MEPNVFIGQLMKGIVGVLCSFEVEHYPSNSIDPWCLITEYLNEGICFLVGFGKAIQYPCMCQKICYRAQSIYGILGEGYACSLSLFGHEQYPFKSLDQNNSAHGVYNVAQ
jgi:hypothetical protein